MSAHFMTLTQEGQDPTFSRNGHEDSVLWYGYLRNGHILKVQFTYWSALVIVPYSYVDYGSRFFKFILFLWI